MYYWEPVWKKLDISSSRIIQITWAFSSRIGILVKTSTCGTSSTLIGLPCKYSISSSYIQYLSFIIDFSSYFVSSNGARYLDKDSSIKNS